MSELEWWAALAANASRIDARGQLRRIGEVGAALHGLDPKAELQLRVMAGEDPAAVETALTFRMMQEMLQQRRTCAP